MCFVMDNASNEKNNENKILKGEELEVSKDGKLRKVPKAKNHVLESLKGLSNYTVICKHFFPSASITVSDIPFPEDCKKVTLHYKRKEG